MTEEQLQTTLYLKEPAKVGAGSIRVNHRNLMSIALIVSDVFCLLLSNWVAIFIRFTTTGKPIPPLYTEISVLLCMAVFTYFMNGLYKRNLSAVEELRSLSLSTTIYFLCVAAFLFLIKQSDSVSRLAFLLAWVMSLVSVPFARELVRVLGVRAGIWGEPVVIFGNGRLGNDVAEYLRSHPKMGFKPVAVVDRRRTDRAEQKRRILHDNDVLSGGKLRSDCFEGIRTAFLVVPETSQKVHTRLVDEQALQFERLIMVTSPQVTSSLCIQPLDIGGILGLEVGQNLLNKGQMRSKRLMDMLLIFLSLPLLLPLFGVITLLIKLDSRGSVFYRQDRVGYGGKHFRMWKFRSMHRDADAMLIKYLEENPDLQAEWEATFKLKNDPRITRVGRFLRKYSLDEFPQLINVFMGEMGLVGPRPIVNAEIIYYNRRFELYKHVAPGMTGMWQISGRSNTSYESRISFDEYYVRNWSIWLDLHILMRTVFVVIKGTGSY